MDSVITRNINIKIKAVAVMLMVCLHTFAFPDRIKDVSYISLLEINGVGIEYYMGRFGSICVGMFLFLSGYGLYKKYNKVTYKDVFKKIINLCCRYWIILSVFVSIGIFIEKYKFNLSKFINDCLLIEASYNPEAWFLRLYVMLLLLYPIILKIINKVNKVGIIICISFLLNIIGFILSKLVIIYNIQSIILENIGILLGGNFLFVFGIIVVKYRVFSKLSEKNVRKKIIYFVFLCTIPVISIVEFIPIIGEVGKLILIPIFIFLLSKILDDKESILNKIGLLSTDIWLMHSFFCYYLFQEISFYPSISVLIFLWIMLLSITSSYILKLIINIISLKYGKVVQIIYIRN